MVYCEYCDWNHICVASGSVLIYCVGSVVLVFVSR